MGTIVVTGGSGKAGRAVVADLVAHGEDVLSVDLVARPELPPSSRSAPISRSSGRRSRCSAEPRRSSTWRRSRRPASDRTSSRSGRTPPAPTTSSAARDARPRARRLGEQRDGPRAAVRPGAARVRAARRGRAAAPELQLRALQADLGGARAPVPPLDGHPVRRPPLLEHHGAARLRAVPRLLGRPAQRKWNLWGYVDASDVAQSCRLALGGRPRRRRGVHHRGRGHRHEPRRARGLIAEVYPGVELRGEVGGARDAALDRQGAPPARVRPAVTWRDQPTGRST